MNDLVSILIPYYNADKYLKDCLDAILNQTYKNIELIMVNDGSTDNGENIVDSYEEKFANMNMKLIKVSQKNEGQASACNNGLKYVTGKYLYWQDADDVLELDGIEKLHNYLVKHEDCQIVRGKVSFRKEESFDEIYSVGQSSNPDNTNIFDNYLFENDSYCFCGIFLVRMDWFDKCNPKRELYISRGGQNYQMLLPITYKGKCGYVDEFIYNVRVVANSHSHSVTEKEAKIKRCDLHEDIILNTFELINFDSEEIKNKYIERIRKKYQDRKEEIRNKS